MLCLLSLSVLCFFFNDTATTEIYTLSLHDALPICQPPLPASPQARTDPSRSWCADRKSTRLNSSHEWISYAVFCLKKKKNFKREHEICISKTNNKAQAKRFS